MQVWYYFEVQKLLCMAPVSRHWAYHLSTPAALESAPTAAAAASVAPLSSVRRHLSLVRAFRYVSVPLQHLARVERLLTRMTGVEQLNIRVQKVTDDRNSSKKEKEDGVTELPVSMVRTWLPRCTRLVKLHWEARAEYIYSDQPTSRAHMQHIQHALSHLPPTLTELNLDVRAQLWHDGAYACVMAALPPLSVLSIRNAASRPPSSLSAAAVYHLSTWRALTQRHAATLHTLHIPNLRWSWATWGQLGRLTHVTELDVSDAQLPREEAAADQEHVTPVGRAYDQRERATEHVYS